MQKVYNNTEMLDCHSKEEKIGLLNKINILLLTQYELKFITLNKLTFCLMELLMEKEQHEYGNYDI